MDWVRAKARVLSAAGAVLLAFFLAACSDQAARPQSGGVKGEDGYTYFGGSQVAIGSGATTSISAYLWRAALETVSFMPLASADAYGGALITDWYAPPETPDERFKVNIFVTGQELLARNLRAVVFKQVRQGGEWVDAPVDTTTNRGLEDTVLTRARQLRNAATAR